MKGCRGKLHVVVTQDHLERGIKAVLEENKLTSESCLLAQAIQDAAAPTKHVFTVGFDNAFCYEGKKGEVRTHAKLPPTAGRAINAFDNIKRQTATEYAGPELPFEFDLTFEA